MINFEPIPDDELPEGVSAEELSAIRQDTAIFDSLPKKIRETIAFAPFPQQSSQVLPILNQLPPQTHFIYWQCIASLANDLMNHQGKLLRAWGAQFKHTYGYELPSIAAKIPVQNMFTRPLKPGMHARRRRRPRWQIVESRNSGDETMY